MKTEPVLTEIAGLTVRMHLPEPSHGPLKLLLMVHGWQGNEDVMWVFARKIPPNYAILAPRAPFPAKQGGYSWIQSETSLTEPLAAYQPAFDQLSTLIANWSPPFPVDRDRISLLGFSQGAAVCLGYTLTHPHRVERVGGLAGFLPSGIESSINGQPLTGIPVYLAHGTKDERVPVERARSAVQNLEKAGAEVTYCEAEVGHKLSAGCFSGLETFFSGAAEK